jgi:putative RNA 2'-phosphotransferase
MEHELPALRLDGGLPRDARGEQGLGELDAVGAAFAGDDEARAGEIAELDRALLGERVRGGHGEHLGDLGEAIGAQAGRGAFERRDAELGLALAHGGEGGVAVAREEVERALARGGEGADRLAEEVEVRALARAEDDGGGGLFASQAREEGAGVGVHLAAEGEDAAAVGGELEALATAGVELDAELFGELLDLHVQRGLREMERAGGAGEILVLGEDDEGVEPGEVEHEASAVGRAAAGRGARELSRFVIAYPKIRAPRYDSVATLGSRRRDIEERWRRDMGYEKHIHTSKQLSWLLRHGAREAGVSMDAAGWVPVSEVLRFLGASRAELDEAVAQNTKARLEVHGERIRACQGHSTEGMPVTQEALEASWRERTSDGSIWHGTSVKVLAAIAREGIVPQARTHVHLTSELGSAVGKRAQVDVMLEVSPARLRAEGLRVFESPNGVVLVRKVPPGCIVGLRAMVEKARRNEANLRALFESA